MEHPTGAVLGGLATLVAIAAALLSVAAACRAEAGPGAVAPKAARVYVGTYTGPKSKGIYQMRLDPATGALSAPELAAEAPNPSFLAIHPSCKFLYSADEVWNGPASVSAFSIAPNTGKLALLNKRPPGGAGPCYVSVDPSGRCVFAANYGSGSVAAWPVGDDGRLGEATATIQHTGSGPDAKRQQGPHAHCIDPDPAGKFALACDLGLDKVLVYRLDAAKGTLAPNDPPSASVAPGAGPRHLAFHPNGKYVYVISEMGSTVTAFAYEAPSGALKMLQEISTLPADFKGTSDCAEIAVHPSGRFLYGSNRGHDSIAIFAIDAATGKLKALGHEPTQGKEPRGFGIDPTGAWLLAGNQKSDSLVLFRIDAETGRLKPTGAPVDLGAPVCVKFLPMP